MHSFGKGEDDHCRDSYWRDYPSKTVDKFSWLRWSYKNRNSQFFFHWFVFIHLNIAVVFHFIHLKWSFQFVLYVYFLLCRIIYYANQSLIVSMSMQYEMIWPLVFDCIRYNDNCKHYVSIMVQMCLLHIKLSIHHALKWFTRKWWTDSYEQLWYQWINRSWLASHRDIMDKLETC